jgi:hypothetical protein
MPSQGRSCQTCAHAMARVRVLLVILALTFGAIAGLSGGILASATGATVPASFISGSVAFVSAVSLAILIENSLGLYSHALNSIFD